VEQRVEAIAGQARDAVCSALDPAEGILAQREVMGGGLLEAARRQQPPQGRQREVVEVTRQVEVKPSRPHPARLRARGIRDGHDQPAARAQDPVDLLQGLARIDQVLEHVPHHDLVEIRVRVAGIGQTGGDADARAGIGSARGGLAQLDPVYLETPVRQDAEQHAAPAAHVQHTASRCEPPGEELDVAGAHDAHQPLDGRPELDAGASVVLVGIERRDTLGAEHRLEAAQAAAVAYHHLRLHPLYGETRPDRARAAHDAGLDARRARARAQGAHAAPVEILGRGGGRVSGHASGRACDCGRERSSARRWAPEGMRWP
jgi:hypothetical protein